MTLKVKFPKFFRSTKSPCKAVEFASSYPTVLYIETLIMLSEKMDAATNETLKQVVYDYLTRHANNYEEAKKQLFADVETQRVKYIEGKSTLFSSQSDENLKKKQKGNG